jgi:hypothetical protein
VRRLVSEVKNLSANSKLNYFRLEKETRLFRILEEPDGKVVAYFKTDTIVKTGEDSQEY